MPTLVRTPQLSELTKRVEAPPASAPGGDTTVNVFTVAEVAEIVQVSKSRIKNWTIGRPLKIVPKVRAYRGKGSRNLYSLQDVYLFALVTQLHDDGLSTKLIEYILEGVLLGPRLGPVMAVILHRPQGKWKALTMTGGFDWDEINRRAAASRGLYFLNVRAVLNHVNESAAKIRGGE
jgi:DNA-binding transcriptional MerR regulator